MSEGEGNKVHVTSMFVNDDAMPKSGTCTCIDPRTPPCPRMQLPFITLMNVTSYLRNCTFYFCVHRLTGSICSVTHHYTYIIYVLIWNVHSCSGRAVQDTLLLESGVIAVP